MIKQEKEIQVHQNNNHSCSNISGMMLNPWRTNVYRNLGIAVIYKFKNSSQYDMMTFCNE